MDNKEHHPHVTYSSEFGGSRYKQDYYDYKAPNPDDCGESLGCGCLALFILCVAIGSCSIFFLKYVQKEFEKNPPNTNFCLATDKPCNDAKEEERRQALEKQKQFMRDSILAYVHMRDSIRHEILRQDSIERYNRLYDSMLVAIRIQDSIDAELAKTQKVKAEYIAFIDDGITSREVKVNAVADSLTEEGLNAMGMSFNEMAWNATQDRQSEIDNNKNYYTKFERIKTDDEP